MSGELNPKNLRTIILASGILCLMAAAAFFGLSLRLAEQGRGEEIAETQTIMFMQQYDTLREKNLESLILRRAFEDFERELKKTRVAVKAIFDPEKTSRGMNLFAGGVLAVGGAFLAAWWGMLAGRSWTRPLAFWSVAGFGAVYIVYAAYRTYDRYHLVKKALEQHYTVVAIADPASASPQNVGAEALWAVVINFFSLPSIILHLLLAGIILFLLRILRRRPSNSF